MNDSDIKFVMLGKTGAGKSSLCNTIFGENLFQVDHSVNSGTKKYQQETRLVNGRQLTLIDLPGVFDTSGSDEYFKHQIARCITECATGSPVFLILLKVQKFTTQENQVIDRITKILSEHAFKHAAIVFTHGDQLPPGTNIEEFVSQNRVLQHLLSKCGGRCHVVDNKHWNDGKDGYRCNRVQVTRLIDTMVKLTEQHKRATGSGYTNTFLQKVRERLGETSQVNVEKGSSAKNGDQAKQKLAESLAILAAVSSLMLLGALLGSKLDFSKLDDLI